MERRGARVVAQPSGASPVHAEGPFKGYVKLDWIHSAAKERPSEARFTSLVHHVNEANLRRAFQELDGSKAPGIDRVTKDQYRKDLDAHIEALARTLRDGGWRPRPSRQVLIPKPQGGTRPLAVGCLEDKIVQTLAARILEAVFEPVFSPRSYGFRRGMSAHQAIGRLYETIDGRGDCCVVVEMDIEKFFDSMDHDWLMQRLATRIADPNFLGLIRVLLEADVLKADGTLDPTELGTPQGSPVSPVLANIYLHFLLDEWFTKNYANSGRMIRYADDAVFVFDDPATAEKFRSALVERMAEGKLRLNLDKSSLVPFSRRRPQGTVAFLGFELYWGRDAAKRRFLKLKTQPKRLSRSISAFTDWIKATRNRRKLDHLWRIARAKMQGHFNYFGVRSNSAKLNHFYVDCVDALFKWLNRRSQKRSFTWERFARRLAFNPLPRPAPSEELRDVSSEQRSLKHKPKSRMREIRTSGSVRSRGWQHPRFT
jgi:group II intron reverse transcriptase/maturase